MKKVKVESRSRKSKSTKIDIDHVAKLANLPLNSKEKTVLSKKLSDIVRYIYKLNEVKTQNVEPIGHITGLVNIVRADEPSPSLSQEDALANASKTHNGFFEVDAIFQEESQTSSS